MTQVLMVASEASPFAKTGGLADVMGALPAALNRRGEQVAVLLPRYREVRVDGARRVYDSLPVWLGGTFYDTTLYRVDRGAPFFLLDYPPFYDRDSLYGDARGDYPDNHLRFALLARAALEVVRRVFRPQVIHCHDWQTGLIPAWLRGPLAGDPTFAGIRTLFTIHNLGYQGRFPRTVLPAIGLDAAQFNVNGVEFLGDISYLKAGLYYADALSTVSRTYAREIQTPEHGFGLDGLLRTRAGSLTGILNGADYAEWNPATDPHIAAHFTAEDLSGKHACKLDLLREVGLDEGVAGRPVLGIISRFAGQKGFDLLAEIAEDLVRLDITLVALGSGEALYEQLFRGLAAAHPAKVGVRIGYDNRLAHKIEAGADIFLMPSRYEPCGLSQLYSLRYGTIPVVRATGGLDDTIEEGTGFKFRAYSGTALLGAVRAALAAYSRRKEWTGRMRRAMERDFSWQASAAEYSNLYERLAAGL